MGLVDKFNLWLRGEETQVVQLVFTPEHLQELATALKPMLEQMIQDEFNNVEQNIDNKFENVLNTLGRPVKTILTDIQGHIDTQTAPLGNMANNIINGLLGKLPHFPGFGETDAD